MTFVSNLKNYFDHSSVHGFPHITDTNKSLAERGFWTVICSLAGYATWLLLRATLNSYKNNAVSFIVDPDYLHFNTTFPSLSICEKYDRMDVRLAAEKIYGPDRDVNIEMFIRDIAYFDGSCGSCKTHCKASLNCSGDYDYIAKTTRKQCSDLIHNCTWNEQPFDCCSEFLPLQTEIGPCYSINSANTMRSCSSKKGPRLQFSMNRETGPAKLTFVTKDTLFVYLHSSDDVPTLNHPRWEKALVNDVSELRWVIKILEIYNDPLLKSLSISQRNCWFPDEIKLQSYNTYSFSGCLVDCRLRAQQEFCNCTHHFMPRISGVKTCDLDGLVCISNHIGELRNIECNCTASCVEPDFETISKRTKDTENTGDEQSDRRVVVKMDDLPNVRMRRVVVRTKLDLVVSMGSTIGLFLGATLLSSVEIPYFLFIRRRTPDKTSLKRSKIK